ncbi:hypothetical protein D9619_002246 [Psilocybe cf. subviscida]|uniref:Uncharacterized protein n=1 Tax=Psilocybe cf. subviscida TaxID=2480587 RepID=A0A8H5F2U2_9AGAR|nr:hypothetical protein D9619_002246 [Psilocybe cf. subviscida]
MVLHPFGSASIPASVHGSELEDLIRDGTGAPLIQHLGTGTDAHGLVSQHVSNGTSRVFALSRFRAPFGFGSL